ncbi:thioredoxin fold domain-containing protein [Alphaproteobacteria bacterium]|nr:thioredoxin fold domain-containing protein [Alphaproteobacteria bacterium]
MKIFLTALAGITLFSSVSFAQEAIPEPPGPLQTLATEGAQLRYLGKDFGVDGWMVIKNGREQYFYVLPGGEAFLSGIMYDKKGKVVTVNQVRKLIGQGDSLLDTLASNTPEMDGTQEKDAYEFKSPSEQLFYDIENSNWIPLGQAGAPVAYAFIDPQCGFCHAFIDDVRGDIDAGSIQLRVIPVGFKEETRAQAAFLIATPNPQDRLFKHLDGDKTALPAKSEINDQGVQRNLAIMKSWELSATPMVIYRSKDGSVKIVRGRPESPQNVIGDLGNAG